MLTMNEKDKNEMLEAILNENEAYQCKVWTVIMAGAATRKKSRNAAFWKRKNENFFDESCNWL